jgi:RNA polymerase sigma factor (sigma-70 family)
VSRRSLIVRPLLPVPAERSPIAPPDAVARLSEHLFRDEWARLVSLLTGILGVRNLQLAEDVVQEAMLRAFNTWPYSGIPDNPPAWLMRTARNLALDTLRREQSFREKAPDIARQLAEHLRTEHPEVETIGQETLPDQLLCLIFACCHPILSTEQQVALALKVVCGFSDRQIARAFLVSEAAMAKRLTRARCALRDADVAFALPEGSELAPRLGSVLRVIYLLFNEGHNTTEGEELVRRELCAEALRLAGIIAAHPATDRPECHALISLLCFNSARLPARTDPQGRFVPLADQDRSRWDRSLIQRGMRHLARASHGAQVTEYHLQAAISACHCTAADEASTDWPRILALYDDLLQLAPSPVVMLNRTVALAKVHGAECALSEMQQLVESGVGDRYPLTHAVLGDLELQRSRRQEALHHFRRALALTSSTAERRWLDDRIRRCG